MKWIELKEMKWMNESILNVSYHFFVVNNKTCMVHSYKVHSCEALILFRMHIIQVWKPLFHLRNNTSEKC